MALHEQNDYKQDLLNGTNGHGITDTAAPPETSGRSSQQIAPEAEEYIQQVEGEIASLGAHGPLVRALAERELARIKNGEVSEHGYLVIHKDFPVKVIKKIMIPTKEYPTTNFVGRLLGPKGSTLKGLQAQTRARIMIFGRGSMWDKTKEEEARVSGDPKYAHLTEDLHIYVEITAYPVEVQARFAHVLTELKKFLDPNHPQHYAVAGETPPGGVLARPPMPGMRGPPGFRGPRPPISVGAPPRQYAPPRPPAPVAAAPAPTYDTTGYYGGAPSQPESAYPSSHAAVDSSNSGYGYSGYPSGQSGGQTDYSGASSGYEAQSQQAQQYAAQQQQYAAPAQQHQQGGYGAQPAYGQQPSAVQPSYGQVAPPAYGQAAAGGYASQPSYGQPQQSQYAAAPAPSYAGYPATTGAPRPQQYSQPGPALKKTRLAAPYGGPGY